MKVKYFVEKCRDLINLPLPQVGPLKLVPEQSQMYLKKELTKLLTGYQTVADVSEKRVDKITNWFPNRRRCI